MAEKKVRRFAYVVNGDRLVTFSRISKRRLVVLIDSAPDGTVTEEAKGDVEAFLARLVRWAEQ